MTVKIPLINVKPYEETLDEQARECCVQHSKEIDTCLTKILPVIGILSGVVLMSFVMETGLNAQIKCLNWETQQTLASETLVHQSLKVSRLLRELGSTKMDRQEKEEVFKTAKALETNYGCDQQPFSSLCEMFFKESTKHEKAYTGALEREEKARRLHNRAQRSEGHKRDKLRAIIDKKPKYC